MTNAYYILQYEVRHCLMEIRVNDIFAVAKNVEDEETLDFAVNNLIYRSGMQQLSCRIRPLVGAEDFEKEAGLKCSVTRINVDLERPEEVSSSELLAVDLDASCVEKKSLAFFADVPYELADVSEFPNLSLVYDLKGKVAQAYSRLNAMLDRKQYDLFMQQLMMHDSNLATSMYWNLSEEEKNFRIEDFKQLLKSGFRLRLPQPDEKLAYYSYGHLVRYCSPDGNGTFALYDEATDDAYLLDMYFYLDDKDDELKLI